MKLYVYDHCPFCAKARMIFGLKSLPLELSFLLEDDADTPTALVGRKTAPILEKADGSHMAESMDIVHHIDGQHGEPLVTPTEENSPIKLWREAASKPILELSIPRLADPTFRSLQRRTRARPSRRARKRTSGRSTS